MTTITNNQSSHALAIVMANYNQSAYLRQAITSVLEQTCADWVLYILDDCSTDDSWAIINSFLPDPRIRAFQNPVNMGYLLSSQKLIQELAHEEWVSILDSDDLLDKNAVASFQQICTNNTNARFFYSQLQHIDSTGQALGIRFGKEIPKNSSHLLRPAISHWKIFQKSLFSELSGYNPTMQHAEDTDFLYRAEEITSPFFIPTVLYYYRRHPNSITNRSKSRILSGLNKHHAMWQAYNRRQTLQAPNLSKIAIAIRMLKAAGYALYNSEWQHALQFFKNLIKLV